MDVGCKVLLFVLFIISGTAALTICKSTICNKGKETFLLGVNQAWSSYARDFGNNRFKNVKSYLVTVLSDIHDNGGNSIRIFLHTDGSNSPKFAGTGFVTAADSKSNHIIIEMKEYLNEAKKYGIFVFFVLWNFAVYNPSHSKNIVGLVNDDKRLESYIDKALIPIVKGLKGHSALGGYDIANEPEGAISTNQYHRNLCFNTRRLKNTGVGWWKTGQKSAPSLTMQRMLRFLNWQAHAIKTHDPGALVTVGAWSQKSVHNLKSDSYNYYSDMCLLTAGGLLKYKGKLDFYQMHTYAQERSYDSKSPMKLCASDHKLDKPIVIGEFSASGGDGRSIEELFNHAYNGGYAGAWSWHATGSGKDRDSFTVQKKGLKSINISIKRSKFSCKWSWISKWFPNLR